MSLGLKDVLMHARHTYGRLVQFPCPPPGFPKSEDIPLSLLTDQTLTLVRTCSSPHWSLRDEVCLWKVNTKVMESRRPRKLRAAVFHAGSFVSLVDGVGVLRHAARTGHQQFIGESWERWSAKWVVAGAELAVTFWVRATCSRR